MNTKIILIVDDEPTNISVVASLLQDLYQIRVATDGMSALKILENEIPDLILLDIEMPNMSGYEVANILKSSEESKNIPFIFLTAKNDLKSIVKGFSYGAVDYISKPFAKEELLARVSTHLKIHYLQQYLFDAVHNLEDKMAELEKNKNFLNSILSNSAHMVITTDLNGTITLFNKKAQKLLGYTSDEVIGRHTPALFHKELQIIQRAKEFSKELNIDLEPNFEVFSIKTNQGLENHDEWIYISKDGNEFPVSLSITALKDLNGDINGYLGIAEDITAIKDKERLINEYIKKIEEISITDGLTGIYNRRHFDKIFPKVINSAKRENNLVGFVMLDIDHFKQYNDIYGHQMGDETLIRVAKSIKDALKRADDYCFRLGGEEFGVIFREDTKEGFIEFANKIRIDIENLQIAHSGNSASRYVTVSIGVIYKRASEIDSGEELYKKADKLLYQAKESGRNRVCV